MVGRGADAFGNEEVRRAFRGLARQAVDDAALPRAGAHEAQDEVAHPISSALFDGVEFEIRTEEGALDAAGRFHAELGDDVVLDFPRRRGGERQHGHAAKTVLQPREIAVGGPEVVPPLADAMGFIHGDEPQVHLFQERRDVGIEPFRSGVDQLVVARFQREDARAARVRIQA